MAKSLRSLEKSPKDNTFFFLLGFCARRSCFLVEIDINKIIFQLEAETNSLKCSVVRLYNNAIFFKLYIIYVKNGLGKSIDVMPYLLKKNPFFKL